MKSHIVNRCSVWIACLAMLFASLVPSTASAFAVSHKINAFQMDICSSEGNRLLADVPLSTERLPVEHARHMADCPFCLPYSGIAVLPVASSIFLPVDLGAVEMHDRTAFRLVLPSVWRIAQPRAPPSALILS